MNSTISKIGLFLCLFLFSGLGLQAQILEAYSSVREVPVGQPFEVSYTLKNVRGNNFVAPKFEKFNVLAGPMQSSSTTIINGQATSEISYRFTLQAPNPGRLVIKPATVRAGKKTIRSASLIVVAKPKKELSLSGKGDLPEVFVKYESNTSEAFTGQQILLDYKLYTSINVQNINIVSESEYTGFFFEPLRRFNNTQTQEVINGKTYVSQLIRRIALFPQQAGDYDIEATQISAEKIIGKRRSGFFTFNDTESLYLTTEPIGIKVKSLPSNAPNSFTGAVGNDFEISIQNSQSKVTTDDAIVLRLTIKGNGDIKRVGAPKLDFGDNFEVYEPKILQEENYENRGELYGKKLVEYIVLPLKAGQYQLQADFSFYNPDSTIYKTISTKTPLINVKQGSNTGKRNINLSPQNELSNNDFIPNKTQASFSNPSSPFFGTSFFWILTCLPILGFFGALFFKKKEEAKTNIDAGEMKMKQAVKVAQEKLATGKVFMEEGKSREFYDEVSRASLGYVGDKLQIPPSEMSKSNVRQKLEALKVSKENVDAFLKILQTCEMALFAGMDNSMAMEETYHSATKVIADIEEEVFSQN